VLPVVTEKENTVVEQLPPNRDLHKPISTYGRTQLNSGLSLQVYKPDGTYNNWEKRVPDKACATAKLLLNAPKDKVSQTVTDTPQNLRHK